MHGKSPSFVACGIMTAAVGGAQTERRGVAQPVSGSLDRESSPASVLMSWSWLAHRETEEISPASCDPQINAKSTAILHALFQGSSINSQDQSGRGVRKGRHTTGISSMYSVFAPLKLSKIARWRASEDSSSRRS